MEGQAGSRPPSDPTLVGLGGLGRRAASPSRTTNPGQGPIQGEASYRVELEDELTGSVAVPPASPGLPSTARTPVPRVQGAQSIVEWTDIFFPDHSHGALSTTSALGPSPLPPNAWQYGSPTATGSTRYLGDNGLASCLTGPLFGSSWDDPSSGWYQPTSPGRLSSPSSSFGLPLAQLPTSPLQYSNNLLPQYLFSPYSPYTSQASYSPGASDTSAAQVPSFAMDQPYQRPPPSQFHGAQAASTGTPYSHNHVWQGSFPSTLSPARQSQPTSSRPVADPRPSVQTTRRRAAAELESAIGTYGGSAAGFSPNQPSPMFLRPEWPHRDVGFHSFSTSRQGTSSRGPTNLSHDTSETGSQYSLSSYPSKASESPSHKRRPAPRINRTDSAQSSTMLPPRDMPARRPSTSTRPLVSDSSSVGLARAPPSTLGQRGKRIRSLSPVTRQNAKSMRDSRLVCIPCKLSKTRCYPVEESGCCQRCQDRNTASSCVIFHFMDLIEEGSTRFTEYHHSISRLLLQGGGQGYQTIDFDQTRQDIDTLRRLYTIQATRDGQVLYTLDLVACRTYLDEARSRERFRPLPQFIREQMKSEAWKSCMRIVAGDARDPLGCLALFDEKPTTMAFRLVDAQSGRYLRPGADGDKQTLYVAHLLSLLFARQIEHAAFLELQKRLPLHKSLGARDLHHLADQLFVIRWRVSLDSRRLAAAPHAGLAEGIRRDRRLCRQLYACFCDIRHRREGRRAPANDDDDFTDRLNRYADTQRPVRERLPLRDSPRDFVAWMREGQALLSAAM